MHRRAAGEVVEQDTARLLFPPQFEEPWYRRKGYVPPSKGQYNKLKGYGSYVLPAYLFVF